LVKAAEVEQASHQDGDQVAGYSVAEYVGEAGVNERGLTHEDAPHRGVAGLVKSHIVVGRKKLVLVVGAETVLLGGTRVLRQSVHSQRVRVVAGRGVVHGKGQRQRHHCEVDKEDQQEGQHKHDRPDDFAGLPHVVVLVE
jgi:hypothetical protein